MTMLIQSPEKLFDAHLLQKKSCVSHTQMFEHVKAENVVEHYNQTYVSEWLEYFFSHCDDVILINVPCICALGLNTQANKNS
jgi:hypothetical protein